ncbi:hypothetical protein OG589_29770 [Sphaerisporangium sp. NBC_01403]|uniref:hypothetical protein n=1 Tax=Sphaerisporangium TaxID=321315 RepID=UPI0032508216
MTGVHLPVPIACAVRMLSSERDLAMYDMYPWNRPEEHRPEDEAPDPVQTALDRRDNGGVPVR